MQLETEKYEEIISLKRTLHSVEHLVYVSSRFTRTTEMIENILKYLSKAYEEFFKIGFTYVYGISEDNQNLSLKQKMDLLENYFKKEGVLVDFSDYTLIKQILLSQCESMGQYRKNLCLVAYLDDIQITVDHKKLIEFYKNLSDIYELLYPKRI